MSFLNHVTEREIHFIKYRFRTDAGVQLAVDQVIRSRLSGVFGELTNGNVQMAINLLNQPVYIPRDISDNEAEEPEDNVPLPELEQLDGPLPPMPQYDGYQPESGYDTSDEDE